MNEGKFVIKHDTWGDYTYYSKHGSFAGKDNVMSYTKKKEAKKFATKKEAENFILNNFPDWVKGEEYIIEEFSEFDLLHLR